jgi:plastocyanin
MRTRAVLIAAGVLSVLSMVAKAPAAHAGWCAESTHGSGSVIALHQACFRPSIVSVEPGATLTFVNHDPFAHNINGQGWGHGDNLEPGQRFSATFAAEGIYPYACTLHPGMTGAIVVGDGAGPGNGHAVLVAASESSLGPSVGAATPATSEVGRGSGIVIPVVLALIAGIVVGIGLASIRRTGVRPSMPLTERR